VIALALCILALVSTFWAGRRSLGQGLVALLAVGYFYGILRANLPSTFSYFIFDVALVGLYLSQSWMSSDMDAERVATVRLWTIVLIVWPTLLVFMPFQPLLVTLVGLRGSIFFIPVLLLGAKIRDKDMVQLANGLAVLNLIALAFAGAEYFTSVMRFYPPGPTTAIIYMSGDVAGGFFRIPAIFTSAHSYGGGMIASLPFLFGLWERAETRRARLLAISGISSALLGVLMSATRQNFVLGCALVVAALITRRVDKKQLALFALLIAGVGFAAMTNARFQRFKTLSDTEGVTDRIAGSVNRGFWEILLEYPMGNGLGGGGTSIPYFLEGQVRHPIGMESEYARILSEQGVIGLLLWVSFILWFFAHVGTAFSKGPWAGTRRMAWCLAVFNMLSSVMGVGLLTSIPHTVILFISAGWTTTQRPREFAPKRAAIKVPRYQTTYVQAVR
jgi:hypothetical protein